ncbi:TetR/AcrR family transcriptional regulator [Aestuariicella hydrocarbonica]|uniref:TetR/AcrR family transcriptional regulator n=1 Tax=Pseudomaricurvus hydrocarbonicus TaxID=1470433 RepID=A0A9E5JUH1_9GAMM|nr:TetR/AcrR family transcriptional regulator [Aestuariicella hydrocarbonica]NHO65701.1 TetR/AcrR family transcriptional regulator [Aestuariicella hydrocarbonica]
MTPPDKLSTSDLDAPGATKNTVKRRRYNSPLREQQMAKTRQNLIQAGVELVHEFPDWDWNNLTFRAVGKRAGVSERTAYRHFATERQLRDAVMEELVKDSGIRLEELELDNFSDVTARIFSIQSSFAVTPKTVEDPTLATMDQQRREALHQAVIRATPSWQQQDQETVAATLDILWNLPSFERLIAAWDFEPERASDTILWVIALIKEAVQKGNKPSEYCRE